MTENLADLLPNVNDNHRDLNNVNDNVKKNRTVTEVQNIALQLSQKLQAPPTDFVYFCKVAWLLPESTIWLNLESVQRAQTAGKIKTTPRQFFTWLCEQDMKKLLNY